ncbi:MAG: SUMF1/EgtB/PvdO family nonheme iron enzyme [Planctomycetota bacterium]|nr:SUMF1/EgtB/PvdO family nonheme iron enzyme [Planctomycetota bacterium]
MPESLDYKRLSVRLPWLPTEAEWEYACRSGTTTSRYFGRSPDAARHYAFSVQTATQQVSPVGMLKPNDYGLFDMLGNISEVVHDRVEQGGSRRRLRGGSVFTELAGLRAAARYYADQTFRNERVGLRVARTILPPRAVDDRLAEVQIGPPVRAQESSLGVLQDHDPDAAEQAAGFIPFGEGEVVCLGTAVRGIVQPRRFRIENLTEETLRITEAYLGGLLTMEGVPKTILPHGRTEFGVAANDGGVGVRSGDLVLRFEAAGRQMTHRGHVTANVHGSIVHVFEAGISSRDRSNQVFDFGTVPFQSLAAHFFSIYHRGDDDLRVNHISAPEGFTLSPGWPTCIETLKFGHFRVAVDTSQLGVRSGRVRIESSDRVEPVFEFDVKANVIDSDDFSVAGVYRDGLWLFDANRDGVADDERIEFGVSGDRALTGDVNGDGVCDLCVCRLGSEGAWQWEFFLRGVAEQPETGLKLTFGDSKGIPLLVDMTGSGIDRPAVVAPNDDGRELLWRFDVDGDGRADSEHSMLFGDVNGLPVAGDWNGDGAIDFGCVLAGDAIRGFGYEWHLRWHGDPGNDAVRKFGTNGDIPIVGDWDADGHVEIGFVRHAQDSTVYEWALDTRAVDDLPTVEFTFGQADDQPIVLR